MTPLTVVSDHVDTEVPEVHRGELRFAERFARKYLYKFMHTPGRGWFVWVGSHWQETSKATPKAAVVMLLKDALRELPDMEKGERDGLYQDIRRCETNKAMDGILQIASAWPGIARHDDELDSKPDLFVVRNGTIDLMTDVFRMSNPADLVTKVAGCDYSPDASCPAYDAGMARWQPTEDLLTYVHRIGGSALQGRSTEQTLPVFHGTGANGKGSTVNDAWLSVFGDYARPLAVQVLLSSPNGGDYLPQKAALKGARLIVTSEPEAGMKFSAGTLKLLTGGDQIDACAKYKDPFKLRPTWQIVMLSNNRPEPPADDPAVWRRLRLVGWHAAIPEDQWDTNLPQKLQEEAPGILNRLLAGWRDYRDNGGIRAPESVRTATQEWRQEVDTIGQFLEDNCYLADPQTGVSVPARSLYGRWKEWCKDNGVTSGNEMAFAESLKKRPGGHFKKRAAGGMRWHGIGLHATAEDDDV